MEELDSVARRLHGKDYTALSDAEADAVWDDIDPSEEYYRQSKQLEKTERQLPGFRYWTIAYTYPPDSPAYPGGTVIRQGAYGDRTLATMNARLNQHLSARVEPVCY